MRELPSVDDSTGDELELSGGLGGTSAIVFKNLHLKCNSFYSVIQLILIDSNSICMS